MVRFGLKHRKKNRACCAKKLNEAKLTKKIFFDKNKVLIYMKLAFVYSPER